MSVANRIFEATKVLDAGMSDLAKVYAARNAGNIDQSRLAFDIQKYNTDLKLKEIELESEQRARINEVLTTVFSSENSAYQELNKAVSADPGLAQDEAWQKLYQDAFNNQRKARNMLFSANNIEVPKFSDAFDIATHELNLLSKENPAASLWIDGTTDKLLIDKYGLNPEEAKQVEVAWKGMQPKSSVKDQKRLDDQLKLWTDNVMIDGKPAEGFLSMDEGIPTAEEQALESSTIDTLLFGAAGYKGLQLAYKNPAVKPVVDKIFQAVGKKLSPLKLFRFPKEKMGQRYPYSTAGAREARQFGLDIPKQTVTGMSRGGLTPLGKGALKTGAGIGLLSVADSVFADAGETANTLPQSAISALQSMDAENTFGSSSGMLSFSQQLQELGIENLSENAKQFLIELKEYMNEYGDSQGLKLMSKKLGQLSDKEKEEVFDYLEKQKSQ